MAEDMFDNGSFLRRRKRYKRANMNPHHSQSHHSLPFQSIYGAPFSPFWIRKPVAVLPATGHAPQQLPSGFNNSSLGLMNYRENLGLFAASPAEMAAVASYHHHQNNNNSAPSRAQKSEQTQFHAGLQNPMKLSPDKLDFLKKNYTSSQQYSSMINAIRRGSSSSGSAGGPVPFLISSDLPGPTAAPMQDGSRYSYVEHLNAQLRPEDDEDESQDIDLMDNEDDGDRESATKIDVESDSDEGNEILNSQLQSGFQLQHQRPEGLTDLGKQVLSRRVLCTNDERESSKGMSPKDYEEGPTDLDFEMFNKKRKYSSVKGFSIENIIGHNTKCDGS